MSATKANRVRKSSRAERQESLREWLSKKCTAQHLVDNVNKIEALDHNSDSFSNELAKYKTANEQRLKILSKYLPDLKSTEFTGEAGEALTIKVVRFGDLPTE